MQYFDTLPKVVYTKNGVANIYTNLLSRVSVIPSFLKNPAIYYQYEIQETDTPEIIAAKYYGDSYRYWIIMFINQLSDAQWDWPLNPREFEEYVKQKYTVQHNINPHNVVHHYEKTITQYNKEFLTTTVNTFTLGSIEYSQIREKTFVKFIGNEEIEFRITKHVVSLYEYEQRVNQSKRTINLLNSNYVDDFEKQFKQLMA
jgi:hypothetical protein